MIPILATATKLASVVPSIIGLFQGKGAEKKAEQVIDIARQVTGIQDDGTAVDVVIKDPEKLLEFKKALLDFTLEMRRADNQQLETINATIRAELASKDKYNSRWRATFGYCVAFAWAFLFIGVVISMGYVVFKSPADAGEIIKAIGTMLSATTILWGVALSILGVTVHKRSRDKEMAAGFIPGGIGGILSKVIK